MMYSSGKWGLWPTLALVISILTSISYFAAKQHYTLPTPVGPIELHDPTLSEFNILATTKHLSSEIGFRTVGSREHAEGDAWLFQEVLLLQRKCQDLVQHSTNNRNLECEVWRQQGHGEHRFDMMGYRLYKHYVNLTNIIVRVSNGSPAGKEHAILVNSHLDSTPPSPGAADDALAVGVMLDCLRVLLYTPNWEPKHAIIFLFNNAEESLQDGSHLYSTQHLTANTVRAIINLEAAGSKGPELLFQATSEELIEAYANVPNPYGTIVANDIFRSGIILSDTDFRQFEQYLDVPGLDMAVVGHSYFYHTQKDTVENIEPGVAQHMGDNTLALLRYFADSESVLPLLSDVSPHQPRIAYFSILGKWFFMYSFSAASIFYTTLWLISVTVIFLRAGGPWSPREFLQAQMYGLRNVIFSTFAPALGANIVALIMTKLLNKSLSWFSRETLPLVLYGPPSMAALLFSQLCFTSPHRENENPTFTAALLWNSTLAVVFQLGLDLGSSAFFMFPTISILAGLSFQRIFGGNERHILLGSYIIGNFLPLVIGTELWCGTGDVFVPLTGRLGEDAPAEFIIASIVAFVGGYSFPLLPAFVHRFGRRFISRCAAFFSILSIISIFYMAQMQPFDDQHPKRVFIIHSENITTGAFHLNFAASDGSPKFDSLVSELAQEFGHEHLGVPYELSPVFMNDWNGDWDTLYPFSAFLTPFRLPLITAKRRNPEEHTFRVSALNDTLDSSAGTRSLTLQIEHPGIIWTVIAFDAYVLNWSLDNNPPAHFARHHIKEASFYGTDVWYLDLVIKLPQNATNSKLKVNFIGTKENVQWPAKKGKFIAHEYDRQDLALLEEVHTWLKHRTGDSVDAMLFGTLGGVVYL